MPCKPGKTKQNKSQVTPPHVCPLRRRKTKTKQKIKNRERWVETVDSLSLLWSPESTYVTHIFADVLKSVEGSRREAVQRGWRFTEGGVGHKVRIGRSLSKPRWGGLFNPSISISLPPCLFVCVFCVCLPGKPQVYRDHVNGGSTMAATRLFSYCCPPATPPLPIYVWPEIFFSSLSTPGLIPPPGMRELWRVHMSSAPPLDYFLKSATVS